MKKVYFLCLLFCMSFAAKAQTDLYIYASGATGSYTTGSAIYTPPPPPGGVYSRNDNIIAVSNAATSKQTGYAVFDLSLLPPLGTINISRVALVFDVVGITVGVYGPCITYGRPGDLSTVINATTLYNACTGTGGTALWNGPLITSMGSYYSTLTPPGLGVGDDSMVATAGVPVNFIGTNAGGKISISFSGGGSYVFNIKGEDGSGVTTFSPPVPVLFGPHAPYLHITYCNAPTGVTATVAPTAVCTGETFTLTGTALGASSYRWYGPAGFSSTSLVTTSIATPTSGGVYRFVAYANCGLTLDSTYTSTTTLPSAIPSPTLTVNPSPAALISPTNTVCTGNTIYMSDITVGGAWSSSNTLTATVSPLGAIVGGGLAGTSVISYRIGVCAANATVFVNNPPTPISGLTEVCASGGTLFLSDGITGGTWSSSNLALATVGTFTGVVTGIVPGSLNINYFTGACPTVSYPITVDPLPTPILGGNTVCVEAALSLSDATAGGAWSSSNTNIATVVTVGTTGVVTGVSAAPTVTITYTLPTGCYVTRTVTVNPLPAVVTGPSTVCTGLTIRLSDATAGGTWSSTLTNIATVGTATGIVSGVNPGVTNIHYTVPVTGCFFTHTVTVDPLPLPISGLDIVCAGISIPLSDATPGGNWSSQLTTIATVDAATGDVTGVAAGVSYITYSVGTGCFVTWSVTVNPLPTAVITYATPTTFCVGGSVTLNATAGAGYSYQWYSNGNPVGPNSPTHVSNSTELMTVEITDGNGCVKMSAGVQVTLVSDVTISAGGPTVFCQPGNVLLSVPFAPGILYYWKLNGVNIPGANSNTYNATIDGVYTDSLSVPGGCDTTTPPFIVTVHTMPNPIVYYTGTRLTTSVSFVSYQWYLNSVAIPGATTYAVTPTVNGSYRVRVTDGNGCTNYSASFAINNLSVGQVNKSDILIYPNPAKKFVHIESPVSLRAVITGMEGQTLMEVENARDVNISKLPGGLYMIMLYDKNGERLIVQKLIKE